MTKSLRDDELQVISGAAVDAQFDLRIDKVETSYPLPKPPSGGGPDIPEAEAEHTGPSEAVLLP